MSRDDAIPSRTDVLRMAREVSNTPIDHHTTPDLFGVSQIERFAALVAAASASVEREACARVCDATYYQHIGPAFGEVRHGIAACAAAIRARGQA